MNAGPRRGAISEFWSLRSPIGDRIFHNSIRAPVWPLARNQHGVLSRAQLRELGFTVKAINHRISKGRLHPIWRGVYAVGRPQVTQRGRWMAAVLACGPHAVLSHLSAAALWRIRVHRSQGGTPVVDVSVPRYRRRQLKDVRLHRCSFRSPRDVTRRDGIPVTSPARTLIDLATVLDREQLEAAVNEADKLGL